MKLQPDRNTAISISGYGPGWVTVNGQKLDQPTIITSQDFRPWQVDSFANLNRSAFSPLAEMDFELLIFGSGSATQFPDASWLIDLYSKRIGVETMDTPAACRTFNFLSAEGRKVGLALLMPT